jgi:hypothetical protein
MKKSLILFLLLCISVKLFAQGTFSGDLMMNLNFFQRDLTIKAGNNPLYDNYLSGSEGWMDLRYNVNGYTFFLRADAFNNSNLKNPTTPNTAFGVGAWSINKDMGDLSITAGYIYDQIGSGILFRAYEDRGLLIDNALVGIELKYKLANNIMLKGFTGQQKDNQGSQVNQFYAPIIKGFNAEGDFTAGKVRLTPGIGVLNRTLDNSSYLSEGSTISSYNAPYKVFTPVYNMYAFTLYNSLIYKNLSWYAEGSYKTKEGIYEADSSRIVNKPGNVEYTSINYGKKGIALSLTGKRTQDYVMRTSPSQTLLDGMLNWQPIVAVLRPERLMSRYTPASQDVSEMAGTANLIVSPNDVTNFTFTYTHINTLDNVELYREGFAEGYYQGLDKWIFAGGLQYLEYNLVQYQARAPHPGLSDILYAVTPFAEITYRLNEKKSFRFEFEYMDTKQDYGSWVYALLEYDVAPRWSVSVSDMYNINVNRNADNPNSSDANFATEKGNNYPTVYAAYTKGPHRFSLAYVKQTDGINCSGGVCRYEPAFSGVKATITTSF